MSALIRIRPLTYAISLIIFVSSCSEPEIGKPNFEPEPIPNEPLPPILCESFVIDGYCDKISYSHDENIRVFLNSTENIEVCALTIYTVDQQVAFTVPASIVKQTVRFENPSLNGYGYISGVEFPLPEAIKSGVYLIENKIPFLVKPSQHVDLLVVYPSNTANAYATSGGKSLYSPDRPPAVSFQRPIPLQAFSTYCLRWLTSLSDINIGYISDHDLDDYTNLEKSEILAIVGHSEYWTRQARLNFDRYVDGGHDAILLSGNTMWWQVRYTDHQLVCYKSMDTDPVADPLLKTYLWNTESLQYPILGSIGADFDHGGYGLKADAGWNGYKVTVPSSPLFDGTNLEAGSIISCPTTEFDGAPIASWANEIPVIDLAAIPAVKGEILAYDKGFRVNETIGTFIVFQKSLDSGVIINTGSTDWCSSSGMGGNSGETIRQITKNVIYKLLNEENVFSY